MADSNGLPIQCELLTKRNSDRHSLANRCRGTTRKGSAPRISFRSFQRLSLGF